MTTRNSVVRATRAGAGFTLLEVLAAVLILGIWFTVLGGAAIQGLRAEGEASRRLRAEMIADARMSDLEGAAQLGALPPIGDEPSQQDEFQVHTRVAVLDLPTLEAAALAGGPAPAASRSGSTPSPDASQGSGGGSTSSDGRSSAASGARALASRLAAQRSTRSGAQAALPGRTGFGGAAGGGVGLTAGATGGATAGATGAAASATPAAPLPANASFFAPTPGGNAPPLRQLQVEVSWDEAGSPRSVVRTSYALDAQAAAPLLQALDQAAQAAEAETGNEPQSSQQGAAQPVGQDQEPEASQ